MHSQYRDFDEAIEDALHHLKRFGHEVDAGHWQGVPTEGKPDLVTRELINLWFKVPMNRGDRPRNLNEWVREIKPNLPWADDHFAERVSRVPSNPGEAYKNWPWWRGQELAFDQKLQDSTITEKFSHTYQERFWPKEAGHASMPPPAGGLPYRVTQGIRYDYGDLDDVVNLLLREPHTRQATFPNFFPEDTGAVHGGRIPCTLHYHFMLRNDQLHLWYPIRSCDAVRHFRDDVYLAVRLCDWVLQELRDRDEAREVEFVGDGRTWSDVVPGTLYFTAYSFHVHKGDMHLL